MTTAVWSAPAVTDERFAAPAYVVVMRGGRGLVVGLWVAVAALLVGGIGGAASVGDGDETSAATTTSVPQLPDSPVGHQLGWVLDALRKPPAEAVLAEHFAPAFLAQIPAPKTAAFLRSVAAQGPFTLRSVQASTDLLAEAVIEGRRSTAKVTIAVEAGAPHLIAGLLIKPLSATAGATSWTEVEDRLRAAAPEVGFLVAQIEDGRCRTIRAVAPDAPLSLASTFKLYVLGAAAEAVERGRLSWDTPLTVRDALRVHSSQVVDGLRDGERRPLSEMADAMISVSDNTATDLVMASVGRASVEAVQATMGMAEPDRNVPFLATRELSLVKFGERSLADEYLALPTAAAKRRFLDDRLGGKRARSEDLGEHPAPVAVDTLEWFGSVTDLCRAHVWLQERAARPAGAPIRRALSLNPGLAFGDTFTYVAYKGGSEAGVLAGSWYLEHADGRRFFIGMLLRNPNAAIGGDGLAVAADAARLAAQG